MSAVFAVQHTVIMIFKSFVGLDVGKGIVLYKLPDAVKGLLGNNGFVPAVAYNIAVLL